MEELFELQTRLRKVQRARELNRKIKEHKMQRLQEVNMLLNQQYMQKTTQRKAESKNIEIRSISQENINELILLLWGKKKKVKRQSSEQRIASTATNKIDSYKNLSYNERRLLTINYKLKSTQRAALISIDKNVFSNYAVQRAMVYPVNLPLSFYDKVRILVFIKVFGQNFDFSKQFPLISTKRIQEFMLAIGNYQSNEKVERMLPFFQQKINEVISSNL